MLNTPSVHTKKQNQLTRLRTISRGDTLVVSTSSIE